ncbi:GGDEF domain-containing protein [Actinoplanes sp. NEAU-A12]|uniref:GGDEF domain-containing protein n=1 Tax=Actinoplanes sandaracinus TaxID=3045177 RepID=A0ABT6WM77_9ACTN|nr:GGDEF domain-containing protein [Actinoplanes sandaracinus]MDI6100837.1 GGDEF domain-containing protein [Actinoplanes sandaracinus]
MRKVTGSRAVPSIDDSLRSRRRAVEAAGLVSRTFGLLCTVVYMSGLTDFAPKTLSADMTMACWLGLGLMAGANLLAVCAWRRPDSRWYPPFSALQVLFDTVTIVAFVIVSERDFSQTTWPLLGLSISIAAIRHQLLGALLAMVATSAAFILLLPRSPDIAFVLGVNAMTAIIAGAQSTAFARQLTTLQETRRALQHQATHDPLTGLPNRAQLAAYADECAGRPLAVLLLDLNGFKQVNDTYGHAAGDLLLHEMGVRLTAALDAEGLVSEGLAGRLGGDEFLVLLPGAGAAAVTAACDRIREAVRRPAGLGDGIEVTVGVSIGVALRPAGDAAGLDALTAEADAAMYREKHGRMAA